MLFIQEFLSHIYKCTLLFLLSYLYYNNNVLILLRYLVTSFHFYKLNCLNVYSCNKLLYPYISYSNTSLLSGLVAETKALCERISRDRVLELHNNGEPVYCTTHRICE